MLIVFVRIWQYDVIRSEKPSSKRPIRPMATGRACLVDQAATAVPSSSDWLGQPLRYLTVDRFESAAAWHQFLSEHSSAIRV